MKVVKASYAVSLIEDGDNVGFGGSSGFSVPDDLYNCLAERYKNTKHPANLTAIMSIAPGDLDPESETGMNKLSMEGLFEKIVASHVGMPPKLGKLVMENKVETYLIPLGIVPEILRADIKGMPGVLSKIGLETCADPRVEGCKANELAKKSDYEVVKYLNIDGEDFLYYKAIPLDVCMIRATLADEKGNLSIEQEVLTENQYELAMATHNSGGIVIAQVQDIIPHGSLDARQVLIPGCFVDYVVKGSKKNSRPGYGCPEFRPELTTHANSTKCNDLTMKLNERKICGRRATLELEKNMLINLGIGMPDSVSSVLYEEGIANDFVMTVETGLIGGVPLGGVNLGAAINPDCLLSPGQMLNAYDGGCIDMTVLGSAQIDRFGNVNVSKFGKKATGPGGFIDITQNTQKICFVGTFTTGGLKVAIKDGQLQIVREGQIKKFVKNVQQITFSGSNAISSEQDVLYITERAVFKLTEEGLTLIEIAPGIDLERDVIANMEFRPSISNNLSEMDPRIFSEGLMGLKNKY